jgi:hypothetical protein
MEGCAIILGVVKGLKLCRTLINLNVAAMIPSLLIKGLAAYVVVFTFYVKTFDCKIVTFYATCEHAIKYFFGD